MRNSCLIVAALIATASLDASPGVARPLVGAGELAKTDSPSLVQDARIFCYNTRNGRFLHWGSCGGRRIVFRPTVPRVYCRMRYSGRFLHWGRC